MNKFKEAISQIWGVPKDVALNLERIIVTGNREIYVENYKAISRYTTDEIVLLTESGTLHICGKKLQITFLRSNELMVCGEFEKIYHEIQKKR